MTNLRDALRALRATPLVTILAILSLAIGIGANTAMFSIVDALILRSLPVRSPSSLALLTATDQSGTPEVQRSWTNPIWESIRARQGLYDGAFAYGRDRFDLAERGEVDPVDGLWASGGMFRVLGVNAVLGRTFAEADDQRGGGPNGAVAVISYGFWQRKFGGAGDIIGRTITLNRVPFTVVGVTGPEFFGPEVGNTFDVAVPLGTDPLLRGAQGILDSRNSWWLRILVRLAPGQTPARATAALRAVQPRIADETRPTSQRAEDLTGHLSAPFVLVPAPSGTSQLRASYEGPLFALMGIVALTLLIACGNIANLLLGRATARRHEFSVRAALGASSGRLARQLFSESLMLSFIGAALGVVFAFWGSRLIVSTLSTAANRVYLAVGIDWRMLAFTAGVAVGTALLFGVVPSLRAAHVAPIEAMKDQGRGTSSSRRMGLSDSLVIAQVALSLVLLIGAGLFVRSFISLTDLNPGFDRERALLVTIRAQRTGLDSAARGAMYERIEQGVRGVPRLSHAALSVTMPVGDNTLIRKMVFPGKPELSDEDRIVLRNFVSAGWFATLGTPMLAGRDFDGRDRVGTTRTMIVNRAFAKKYFGEENPIGRTITETQDANADPAPIEIVGVVGNAVYRSLRAPAPPTMYWPLAQMRRPPSVVTLTVRASAGAPELLARSVGDAVMAVNKELAMSFRTLADQVDASIATERLVAKLSGFFGAFALLLAALGLYGITAYAVSRRQVEIGIRMALGTSPGGVMRLVLGRTGRLVGGGLLIGTVASAWAATFVATMLYGLAPRDPVTIVGAVLVIAGVALLAAWLPARRAVRIDPAVVLREG